MSEPVHDTQTDPAIDAIATLLEGVLLAKFGADGLGKVLKYPVRLGITPATQYPALAVYRKTDRLDETSDNTEEYAVVMLGVDYYLPHVGADRVEARWPMLRAVYALVGQTLRVGYHPSVSGGAQLLSSVGFLMPSKVNGLATYDFEPTESGLVPCFKATFTLRVSTFFDWSDYEADALEGIDTDGVLTDSPTIDAPSWDDVDNL